MLYCFGGGVVCGLYAESTWFVGRKEGREGWLRRDVDGGWYGGVVGGGVML